MRLSLDLTLQAKADQLLGGHTGSVILMNAETGEILTMASHPTYDPNNLDTEGDAFSTNPSAPLVNRAAQGLYPIGDALRPLLLAKFGTAQPSTPELNDFYQVLGLNRAPAINMPVSFDADAATPQKLKASPLQLIIAAALLSNQGLEPTPRIAMAVDTPEQGWVVLSAEAQPIEVIPAGAANEAALSFIVEGKPYWRHVGQGKVDGHIVTWLLSGTLPDWGGTPLVIVVTLEEDNSALALRIGNNILDMALNP